MQTILVINSKGGSGKTTLTTNLASYFACRGHRTAIMDYDPQGSSLQWLKVRPQHQPAIHGANAAPSKDGHLRSISMAVPANIEYLIIDAPAGVDGVLLQEMVRKTNYILIPVASSAVDIHATTGFIKDLLLRANLRSRNVKAGIIANRVRNSVPVYKPLESFLNALELPFLTRLSDSDNYINAVELGLGVFEMDEQLTVKERDELKPVIDWLDGKKQHSPKSAIVERNVAHIDTVRLTVSPLTVP